MKIIQNTIFNEEQFPMNTIVQSEFAVLCTHLTTKCYSLQRALLIVCAVCSIGTSLSLHAQLQQGRVMQYLSRYSTGLYNQGGLEVVTYSPSLQRAFVSGAIGRRITAIDMRNPASPIRLWDATLPSGVVNSVAVSDTILAIALEDSIPQNNGRVVFMSALTGAILNQVTVGALPDMIAFSPDMKKVLTANEGEPSIDYLTDPEGSVSIIDISNGVRSAVVTTARFTSYNSLRDSLQLVGIRITGNNNPTVAQDLEPEYITVSQDSRTAFVTLQENNAVAVIDISTATVREIQPLGLKDYRMGLPTLKTYPFTDRPLLGTTTMGQRVLMGGFSGLHYEGINSSNGNWRFMTVTDRGPNAAVSTVGSLRGRPFALPAYQVRAVRFEMNLQTGAATITQQIPLTRNNGTTPITGLPNLQASAQNLAYTDEIPLDLFGQRIVNDRYGADLEGVVVAPNGEMWMCDEYRPALYRFNSNGDLIDRYIPVGTGASVGLSDTTFGKEILPAVYAQRRPNRGFEAIALDTVTQRLYAFIQSPLDNLNTTSNLTSRSSSILRIIEMNTVNMTVTGEYLLPMFESTNAVDVNRVDKIGDAVSLGKGRFMIVERDSRTGQGAKKLLYEININGARNLITNPLSLGVGETPESIGITGLVARGVRLVAKRKVVNIAALGYSMDKVEGLAMINPTTFAVVNDNDFGMLDETISGNGSAAMETSGGAISVGVLSFNQPNAIDVSDRDGSSSSPTIALRNLNVPLFGTFQPDAISSYTVGNQTYYITANEGDVREYGSFLETRRVNDPLLLLDTNAFPLSSNVRNDAQLGRLNVFRTTGDIDGDGDIDELHAQGGRSFSIYTADGSLVWDSGEQFERIVSQIAPTAFNISNTNNTFDSRSTSKGPEPEGITIGKIGDSTYAFICLERIGGVMMYNISNPFSPRYIDFLNSRNYSVNPTASTLTTVGDLGPEVVTFVPASPATSGQNLILCSNEISGTMSVYSIPNLAITQQPLSQIVCPGQDVRLTTLAAGVSVEYQWYKDGSIIAGATQATLTISSFQQQQSGNYTVVVRSQLGIFSPVSSQTATVYAAPRLSVISEPVSSSTTIGSNARFSVETNGLVGTTYQWFRGNIGLRDDNRIRGSRTSKLEITQVQTTDTASNYFCVISSRCGNTTSRQVALQIPRIHIRTQPQSLIQSCRNSRVEIAVSASTTADSNDIIYSWLKNGITINNSSSITGATTSRLVIQQVSISDTGVYQCIVNLKNTTLRDVSSSARVGLIAHIVIAQQPINTFFCSGGSQTAQLSVLATGEALRYQWIKDSQVLSGQTSMNLTATSPGLYSVMVYGVCDSVESTKASITQLQPPSIEEQPSSTTLQAGSTLRLTVLATGTDLQYQWRKNGVAIQGATQSVFSIPTTSLSDAGRYSCQISNQCSIITSSEATIGLVTSVDNAVITQSSVQITPSPAANDFILVSCLPLIPAEEIQSIKIFDLCGKVYDLNRVQTGSNVVFPLRFDITGFVNGLYTLTLQTTKQTVSTPFMIMR